MTNLKPKPNLLDDNIKAFIHRQQNKNTRRAYQNDLLQFLNIVSIKVNCIEQVTIKEIIAYRDTLLQNYKQASVNRKLVTISSMFNFLVQCGAIANNPTKLLPKQKQPRNQTTLGLSDKEVKHLLETCNTPREKLLFHVLLYHGVRISEALQIKKSEIIQTEHGPCFTIHGKGTKIRFLPIHSEVKNILYEYLVIYKIDDLIFPFGYTTAYKTFMKVIKRSNITKHITPHSCRATCASVKLALKTPPKKVMQMFGWNSYSMLIRYDKRSDEITNQDIEDIKYGT